MAVARPQVRPTITGVHVALIAFVVVALASLVFAIILYTGQEELNQRVQSAENNARGANDKAAAQQQQYARLVKLLTGNPELDADAVEQQVTQIRDELGRIEDLPDRTSFAQFPIVTALRQLTKHYADKSREATALKADVAACAKERTELENRVQQQTSQFVAQAGDLQNRFEELKKSHGENEAKWEQSVKAFETSLNEMKERHTERLNTAQAQINRLQSEAGEKQQRINTLVQALEKFRPSQDPRAVLQDADGTVLRVIPEESIAYINLGRKDRITPGLTFAVYSPLGGISKDGKGKGTLEVVKVLPDTAECRITGVEPGTMILESDLIANPVYDRHRRFTFVVAGDFDLNFDGVIDDPDGHNVRKLIASWGGRVVDNVDEQTDFVVLGSSPQPIAPAGTDANAQEAARIKNEEQKQKIDRFAAIRREALALGLPVLTRTPFLHFIGYRVPPNAEADEAL